ncbi:MAG: lectin like domain-containing protein [Oscillospiraceae bacterium]
MKFKKFLAGLLALSTAALNVSVPITAEETEKTDSPTKPQALIAENSKTEEPENNEETEENVDVAREGDPGSDGLVVYDPEYKLFRDQNGNVVEPIDHHPMMKDYAGVTFPSQYDTRTVFADKGYAFPEIKNQNPTGSCWAHAALAASEINGILKGVVSPSNCNFSEAHLNYFSIISDKDTSSDLYGDTVYDLEGITSFNDYYQIYNRGGNQIMASIVLARGSGPVFEPSEWDIGYAEDGSYVILDNSGSYPVIYDTVPSSAIYPNYSLGYYCYKKDGKEIVLNGKPYSRSRNTKNDLYFTPIDEQYRYENDFTLLNTYNYFYDYDSSDLSSVNNVKEAIMENGGLTISYYANINSGMVSSKGGYYYPMKAFMAEYSDITSSTSKSELPTNHTVTIIGWDDSYSKDNFYCDNSTYTIVNTTFNAADLRPQKDGAWLCRNSWGENYGDGGYFYMSYEEPELGEIYSYELAPANTYGDKIYQNFGVSSNMFYRCNSGYSIANIFTAEADEEISAVSFFAYDNNVDYTVSVYTGVSAKSPMSGTLAAKLSGTIEHGGYHTIDLPSSVSVGKGKKFSVVLNTNDTALIIDTYNKGSGNSFRAATQNPTSSSSFYDTYSGGYNVCLKAHTASSSSSFGAPKNVKAKAGNGEVTISWDPVENVKFYVVYRYSSKTATKSDAHIITLETTHTFSSLENNTTYYFRVTAMNDNLEESPMSDWVSATPCEKPDAPQNLSSLAGDTRAVLFWDAVENAESYNVYYYDGSINGYDIIANTTETYMILINMANDYEYNFVVTAVANEIESDYSEPEYITASSGKDFVQPPSNIKTVPGNGFVKLSWENMKGVVYYNVYYGTSSIGTNSVLAGTTEANSVTVSGLTNEKKYYFWISAYYLTDETSAKSSYVTATPTAATSLSFTEQPTDVTVIGGTKFELTASAKASSMKWQYNDGTGWQELSSASSIHYSDGIMSYTAKVSSSLAYKNCTFRCVASDSSGNSVTSNTVKLNFYSESSVTVSMVTALDSTDLVNYVNYFTELNSGNFELTAAQLKAIELVLAADYAA